MVVLVGNGSGRTRLREPVAIIPGVGPGAVVREVAVIVVGVGVVG